MTSPDNSTMAVPTTLSDLNRYAMAFEQQVDTLNAQIDGLRPGTPEYSALLVQCRRYMRSRDVFRDEVHAIATA